MIRLIFIDLLKDGLQICLPLYNYVGPLTNMFVPSRWEPAET
jgi:hypothetical protein